MGYITPLGGLSSLSLLKHLAENNSDSGELAGSNRGMFSGAREACQWVRAAHE